MNCIKDGNTNVPIKNFIRPGYFVPETKSIIEILKELKHSKYI